MVKPERHKTIIPALGKIMQACLCSLLKWLVAFVAFVDFVD